MDAGLGSLSPDLALQLEEAHREGPDLTGMAVLPPPATSGSPSAMLLRLGFLGHVSAQPFADPVAQPGLPEAQPPAADAVHDVFPHTAASLGPAAAQRSRRAGARGPLSSMSGHHRIAQAAIGASGTEVDSNAEVPAQTREALSSLLQDTEVQHAPACLFVQGCWPCGLQHVTASLLISTELFWTVQVGGSPEALSSSQLAFACRDLLFLE